MTKSHEDDSAYSVCSIKQSDRYNSRHSEKYHDSRTNSIKMLRLAKGHARPITDRVVSEVPIVVMVDKLGSFTIMATPSDLQALAVGFIFSEGLIDDFDDVMEISMKDNLPNVIGVRIQNPSRVAHQRNMIVASSCGMCGTRNIEKLFSNTQPCEFSLEVSQGFIVKMIRQMQNKQRLFENTGGSHAAAVLNPTGTVIAFAEDLGRHSALDKAIGECLLTRESCKGCAVAMSGRVSLEMVTKTARAGLELIAAVSAPSSLAIEAANRWHITLCGFVRSDRINIYTHPERICDVQALTQKSKKQMQGF